MITKEEIVELLGKSGIKLLEYSGSLERGCTIQYNTGEIKKLTRTDKLYYRHKKKHSNFIKEKTVSKYEEEMNRLGYEIVNKDEDRFKLKCINHGIEFNVKRDNIRKMLRGNRNNPHFCPECKKNHMKERIEKTSDNIKVITEIGSDKNHRKFLLECNKCSHQFERFSSDIFGQSATSCPNCKPYKERPHPFFKSFLDYSEYVRRLTELNMTRYNKYIKVSNELEVHLDHKFSINDGYDNHLPPWMVACPINLEYITGKENLEKHTKSSITLKEFLGEFNKFLEVEESYLKLFNTP